VDIANESNKKIRQLEYVVNHLSTRIANIAASYELELASTKAELEEVKRTAMLEPEEVD
jgi:hypothetical protein